VSEPDGPRPRTWLHIALFLATFLTTTAQGALDAHAGSIFPLVDGLWYSVPLMAILVCHELGHYFAALHHRVPASLPFFVPLPPGFGLLGTMGAVIFQSGTADRKKLIDIGAAGPLAGFVVALPVLVYGLAHSPVRAQPAIGLEEGNSLLYALLKFAVKGEWLPSGGRDVILHPTAWAGWAGLLVTMLNLMPIGQLDGGHVATAYFGNGYSRAARVLHRGLLLLALAVGAWVYAIARQELATLGPAVDGDVTPFAIAVQAGTPWVVWFGVLHLMKRMSRGEYHPPVDDGRLPRSRSALFWIVAALFVLIFMPVVLRITVGSADVPAAVPTPAHVQP
jgi:membrane-associated protease RseP (regulator of RpoE activity)